MEGKEDDLQIAVIVDIKRHESIDSEIRRIFPSSKFNSSSNFVMPEFLTIGTETKNIPLSCQVILGLGAEENFSFLVMIDILYDKKRQTRQ